MVTSKHKINYQIIWQEKVCRVNLSWCYFFRLYLSLPFCLSLFRIPNCLGYLDSQLFFILILIFIVIVRIIKIVKVKERIITTIINQVRFLVIKDFILINNKFIVSIIFAIIISFMVQFPLIFDDDISCFAIIHGGMYFNLKCTFSIILQHFKIFHVFNRTIETNAFIWIYNRK